MAMDFYRSLRTRMAETNWPIWGILAVTLAFQSLAALGAQASAPLALFYKPEFGLTNAQVGYLSSAVFLGSIIMGIPSGWLIDSLGVRKMTAVTTLFLAGTACSIYLSSSFLMFYVILFVMGVGYGMLNPLTSKIVMISFPRRLTGTAIGIKQTGVTIGGALGAVVLPPIAIALGWRYGYLASGIAMAVVGFGCLLFLKDDQPRQTFREAMADLGSLGTVLFHGRLLGLSCLAFVFGGYHQIVNMFIALYLNEQLMYSASVAAGFLALTQVSGTIGRVVLGVVSDRYLGGRRKGLLSVVEILAGLLGVLLAVLSSGASSWVLGIVVFFLGFTAVGWNGLFLTIAAEIVGEENTALATGVGASITFLGIALLPPVFGYIADYTGSFRMAWFCMGTVAILGALVVALIPLEEGKDAVA